MQNINQVLRTDMLPRLIQTNNFVGWTYSVDYEYALVMTNDLWKFRALGIPHNCFLVARHLTQTICPICLRKTGKLSYYV